MAGQSSGSLTTSKYQVRSLTFSWRVTQQDTIACQSDITWTLEGSGQTGPPYYSHPFQVLIDGEQVFYSDTGIQLDNGTYVSGGTFVVQHDTNTGHGSFSVEVNGGVYYHDRYTVTGSDTFQVTDIPIAPKVTNSRYSATETSLTVQWTSDQPVTALSYSVNGGAWSAAGFTQGATSGYYSITGLTAGVNYSIKTRVRGSTSGLDGDSGAVTMPTYSYPFAYSLPNFQIGSAVSFNLYNPLRRSVYVYCVAANGSTKTVASVTSGTAISNVMNTAEWIDWLYASIPNSLSGNYTICVVYSTNTSRNSAVYTVNPYVCRPLIGAVTYQDINPTTANLTGNDQLIVQNQSRVKYTATGLTALYYATLASCTVSVNGSSFTIPITAGTAEGGSDAIDAGSDVAATITVTDSRGLTASASVNITMLPWELPSAIIKLARQNNYYTETDINVDARYSSIDGHNTITITYQAKIEGSSTYTVTGTLQDNVTSTILLDNEYAWDIVVTLVDYFGGTKIYNLSLSRGMPIIYFDRLKSSVGVNCFPVHDKTLEVNGIDFMDLVEDIRTIKQQLGIS